MKRIIENFEFRKEYISRVIEWASEFNPCVILDSHAIENADFPKGFTYDLIIGVGFVDGFTSSKNSFDKLKEFHQKNNDWLLGYLSYDLKNELEEVSSNNQDYHQVPHMQFFIPETVILVVGDTITIHCIECDPKDIFNKILLFDQLKSESLSPINIKPRIHHAEYIRGVKSLLHHIQMGDIYEANFCQEFYAENVIVNPFTLYKSLMKTSPTPFSAYYKYDNQHLICASPERFIKKTGSHILSQPIKGTAKRSSNLTEDLEMKKNLFNSEKDRIENVMIVDLVRNDLSRTAQQKTVQVDELFGVYSFSNVHQMISSISCKMDEKYHFTDVIKHAFPMGSMTGAPKIMATKLIEAFEHVKRGIYSGSVGYITPSGDFDFNVVIRSLQYKADSKYLSYMVGGAITHNSIPEDEYVECEIKAAAIKEVLRGNFD